MPEPKEDIFGSSNSPEDEAPAPEKEKEGDGKKEEKPGEGGENKKGEEENKAGGGGKEEDEVPDEVKNHPAYKKMGENLKNQGNIIAEKDKRIRELTKDSPIDPKDLPYKPEDIKFSKDLSEEDREEMTEREIKQMDELAQTKLDANKRAEEAIREKRAAEIEAETSGGRKLDKDERERVVDTEIGRLSGGDAEKERELREAVGMLNLSGLTEDQVKERVQRAQSLIPGFKPPKEQAGAGGTAVKTGGSGTSADKRADEILESAKPTAPGEYSL